VKLYPYFEFLVFLLPKIRHILFYKKKLQMLPDVSLNFSIHKLLTEFVLVYFLLRLNTKINVIILNYKKLSIMNIFYKFLQPLTKPFRRTRRWVFS